MKKLLTVYLDSSVILSGLASPEGGSGAVLKAAKLKKLKLVTTDSVLEEVGEHLQKLKIDPKSLSDLLSKKIILLKRKPPKASIKKFVDVVIDPDDAHVVAGAAFSGANYFLSLEKKHILTINVKRILKPMRVVSSKGFWKELRRSGRKNNPFQTPHEIILKQTGEVEK